MTNEEQIAFSTVFALVNMVSVQVRRAETVASIGHFDNTAKEIGDLIERYTEIEEMYRKSARENIDVLAEMDHWNLVCIKDTDEADLLALADELDAADVDGETGWGDRIRKALGKERA